MTNELPTIEINSEDVNYVVSLISLREKQLSRDVIRLNQQVKNGEITVEMFDNFITVVHEERKQLEGFHDRVFEELNKQVYKK